MRFWTLVFAVLVVMMLAVLPLMTSSAQAHVRTQMTMTVTATNPQPLEVAVQVIVPRRVTARCCSFNLNRAIITRPRIVATSICTVRRHVVRPFCHTRIYRKLE